MQERMMRVRLKDEVFRKYKVYCAMNNLSLTEQTGLLVTKFVEEQQQEVKIIKIEKR
jgi:hypothetical protein